MRCVEDVGTGDSTPGQTPDQGKPTHTPQTNPEDGHVSDTPLGADGGEGDENKRTAAGEAA